MQHDLLFAEVADKYYTEPRATYDDGGVGQGVLDLKSVRSQKEGGGATEGGSEAEDEQQRRPITAPHVCFVVATKP